MSAQPTVASKPDLGRLTRNSCKLLIGGAWVEPRSGATFDVEDPATGEVIAKAAKGDAADIDAAVKAARSAMDGPWTKMPPMERMRLMLRLADLLENNREEFAFLETHDVGHPLWFSRAAAAGAPDVVRYNAGWISKINGETMTPLAAGNWHAYTTREPVGVVGLIVPWNSPYSSTVSKLSGILAAGCTVVIKPAEQTPLSTVRLGELIQEAGFPDGVVNVVNGSGEIAGASLVAHPDVDKISFTGSTETGRAVLRGIAGTMKRVTLELGGKSPVIILPDADIEKAIEASAGGIFLNSGQICIACSRLFAHRSVYDKVVEGVARRAEALRVGPGSEPGVNMGPLVSKSQLNRVTKFLDEGRSDGARIVTGGKRIGEKGYFLQPTVIAETNPEMSIVRDEIFGPVLCATAFDDQTIESVAREANNTIYGLAANIWTKDISAAHKLAKLLKAGMIKINSRDFPETSMPFGGFKQSGFGRERGRQGVESYTELKSVMVAL
jgi:phenylacetaldehyde dehydrogenase